MSDTTEPRTVAALVAAKGLPEQLLRDRGLEDASSIVELFRLRFLNREDRLCCKHDGSPHPFLPNGDLDAYLEGHLLGRTPGRPARGRLTSMNKPRGEAVPPGVRVGTYAPSREGTTRWACIDIDGGPDHADPAADPDAAAQEVEGHLREWGLNPHLERSKSGAGWHVWLFFGAPVSAALVRRALRAVVPPVRLAAARGKPERDGQPELYPMSDTLTDEADHRVGRQVWLPMFHGSDYPNNWFHRVNALGELEPYLPTEGDLTLTAVAALERIDAHHPPPERPPPSAGGNAGRGDGDRPGDVYNREREGEALALLEADGWERAYGVGGVTYYRRPGKKTAGISASWGHCRSRDGRPLFYPFTSNCEPLRQNQSHDAFAIYAFYEHGGDFGRAARSLKGEAGGRTAVPGRAACDEQRHRVGDLELRLGKPRQTDSGKVVAPAAAYKGGVLVYPFQVTSTDSSRRGPARQLAAMAGVPFEQADAALVGLVADAARRLASQAEPEGPSLYQVVGRVLPPMLKLTHKTDRGTLWSETYGREVARQEWVTHVTSDVLATCAEEAHDAPAARYDLIAAVQRELAVVWADQMASLPAAADVDLAEVTEAGRRFRRELVALWTRPQTFEVQRAGRGGDVASRASLASRARRLAGGGEPDGRPRWRPIHDAFAAWWRNHVLPGGEVRALLAMRYSLADQIGVEVAGVHDQASLTRLGEMYGCLLTEDDVTGASLTARLSGGGRLAVLSPSLVDELLAQPEEPVSEAFSDEEVPQ